MANTDLAPIDLNPAQVLQFTRVTLGNLLECWDMEYDFEPREEVRKAMALLDLLWENSPEGKAHTAKLRKEGFLPPVPTTKE